MVCVCVCVRKGKQVGLHSSEADVMVDNDFA